jgi:septum formation protein
LSLVLASASPRRHALIKTLGLAVVMHPVDIDETPRPGESGEALVCRLAMAKAQAAVRDIAAGDGQVAGWVLGADTEVVLGQAALGKPRDRAHFVAMMQKLSGRTHRVLTALALVPLQAGEPPGQRVVTTRVRFRPLEEAQIQAYWDTGEPADKAGGYGIQGQGGALVEALDGPFDNVVGLPMAALEDLLWSRGVLPR